MREKDDIRYDQLDLMKLILAIMIMIVHCNRIGTWGVFEVIRFPITRIAVPLFFIISSFLLFSKLDDGNTKKGGILLRFVKNNALYYAAYFILLLPITLAYRFIHNSGTVISFIIGLPKSILFGSTFLESWFISALIIGTLIVYFGKRVFRSYLPLLIIGVALYMLACMVTNYSSTPLVKIIAEYTKWYPGLLQRSFPVSIVWISIGAIFASIKQNAKERRIYVFLLGLIGLSLLFVEYYLIQNLRLGNPKENDCYFSLFLVCPMIFAFSLSCTMHNKNAIKWRSFSKVSYPLNDSVAGVARIVFEKIGLYEGTLIINLSITLVQVLGCYIAWKLLYYLKTNNKLKCLKYMA